MINPTDVVRFKKYCINFSVESKKKEKKRSKYNWAKNLFVQKQSNQIDIIKKK